MNEKTDRIPEQAEQDLAVEARIGGNEYRRRLADLVTRRQPIRYGDLDGYVAGDARSLARGDSYLRGGYSQPWAWRDADGAEHSTPATFHGMSHFMSPRTHTSTLPEAAFDWPIYVAGLGLRQALA